jgi:hypothetical protein
VPGEPLVLVEGPFDKLAFTRKVGDRARCVATGSTGQARSDQWVNAVAQASLVLLAFDDDDAGDEAALAWKGLIGEKATRLIPWAHDVNEMLMRGKSIVTWLDHGLALALGSRIQRGHLWVVPKETPVAEEVKAVEVSPQPVQEPVRPAESTTQPLQERPRPVEATSRPVQEAKAVKTAREITAEERRLLDQFTAALASRQQITGLNPFLANAPSHYGNSYQTCTVYHKNGYRSLGEYTQIILDALKGDFHEWAIEDMKRIIADANQRKEAR